MNKHEKKELQELIKLLYNNNITQSGKRKLEKYIKEMQKEIENKTDDFTTVYMQGFYDGKNKMKDKIKEKIDLIDKEYAELIEKNKINLYLVNINAQRHNAMQLILEELLGE